LPAGVETDRTRPLLAEQLLGVSHDQIHGLVPPGLDEFAVAAHEGSPQPVRRLDGLPAEQILRVEATVIDAVIGTAADSDDPAVTDRELETVAVRVQHRGTGHPALDVLRLDAFGENAVDAHRPPLTRP